MVARYLNVTAQLYVGLMSGTSLDSIDAGLFDLSAGTFQMVAALEYPLPKELRQQLIDLCQPGDNEIDRMGSADRALGLVFSRATNQLLRENNIDMANVVAIGSHGQTIRHRPELEYSFTTQIGDPNTIAFETGITTVADFRRKDIAAGGQGAPLAPAFHRAAFRSNRFNRAIVNIGGIANISFLGSEGACFGFDTGPGNILMDEWIHRNQQKDYDKGGMWAATGQVLDSLLATLLTHPFLAKETPKSTGREDFNIAWLTKVIENKNYLAEDVQATLLEFTARTITREIDHISEGVDEVYICGGGAYNSTLMQRIETLIHPRPLATTTALGIPPQWVESAAFAWLGQQTLNRNSGNICSVTGATREVILGAVHYP